MRQRLHVSRSRSLGAAAAIAIVLVVGFLDYVTGAELIFWIFYLLAIAVAVWFVGQRFAMFTAVLSVAISLTGDWMAGAVYSSGLVPIWNAAIALAFYLLTIRLFSSFKSSRASLEERVRQRTVALAEQMAAREKLEAEILAVGEQERQRIGRDLHDGLCQQLAAIRLAVTSLKDDLKARSLPEAAAATEVEQLLKDAGLEARNLARGIFPVPVDEEGLAAALEELAATTSRLTGFSISFESDGTTRTRDPQVAMHLYRIAQEALNNAINHSKAKHVAIVLKQDDHTLRMTVSDDGCGFPASTASSTGLGLRTMDYRARVIGAKLEIGNGARGGAMVSCRLDVPSAAQQQP
jgi:signal transduction histidine kinase